MDKRTLTALRGSIAKWKAIVEGFGLDDGAVNCPLCKLFNEFPHFCQGCPVSAEAGGRGCKNTPYFVFIMAESEEERKDAALTEYLYLLSLLPEGICE